jgi:hypothetical protein
MTAAALEVITTQRINKDYHQLANFMKVGQKSTISEPD